MTEDNGFYYMRARYYDPEVGRFISEDPIGLEGGINLYAYVGGNPILLIDPLGLFSGQQLLQDVQTAAYAGLATSYFMGPAGGPGLIAFGAIGFVATAIEVPLYSEDPFWDGMRESAKMLIPIKNPIADKIKDEAIDYAAGEIRKMSNGNKSSNDGNINNFSNNSTMGGGKWF